MNMIIPGAKEAGKQGNNFLTYSRRGQRKMTLVMAKCRGLKVTLGFNAENRTLEPGCLFLDLIILPLASHISMASLRQLSCIDQLCTTDLGDSSGS